MPNRGPFSPVRSQARAFHSPLLKKAAACERRLVASLADGQTWPSTYQLLNLASFLKSKSFLAFTQRISSVFQPWIESFQLFLVYILHTPFMLLSFARDPPNAIFGHCFRIHLQVAVTHTISYEIPPKFVNSISNICT